MAAIMTLLSPEEERHSRAVTQWIRRRITAAGGWISFDVFMELALYAPGLGYYCAGAVKLGAGGDFVTAPELSNLFSICIADQCAATLAETGGSILEIGAGTGRMAATILQRLATLDALPRHYLILEISADLRARQQATAERLPARLRDKLIWLNALPTTPIRGVILANEVLDALPCERFVMRGSRPRALGVALSRDGAFSWREGAELTQFAPIQALPDGYRSEICPRVAPWIAGIGGCLERGAIVLSDYGLPRGHYYHPQRSSGTLRCHFKHRAHDDPFINVGVQDITAWVDFTRVAEAADACGLKVRGFATQSAFLLGAGIERLITEASDAIARARLAGEAHQLLMPGEMGEVFKVMVLSRDFAGELSGLSVQDLRHLL